MRAQVNLSDDMVVRVDKIAKTYGVSRSALCSMFIGQMVSNTEKGIEFANNLMNDKDFREHIVNAANVK